MALTCDDVRHQGLSVAAASTSFLPRVYDLLEELGLPRLLICTPAEFLGDSEDEPESDS